MANACAVQKNQLNKIRNTYADTDTLNMLLPQAGEPGPSAGSSGSNKLQVAS